MTDRSPSPPRSPRAAVLSAAAPRSPAWKHDSVIRRLHWAVDGPIDPAIVNQRILESRSTCWCVRRGAMRVRLGRRWHALPIGRWMLIPTAPRDQQCDPGTVLASIHFALADPTGLPLLDPAEPLELAPARDTAGVSAAASAFTAAADALIAAAARLAPGAGRARRHAACDLPAWCREQAVFHDFCASLIDAAAAAGLPLRPGPGDDDLVQRGLDLIAAQRGRHLGVAALADALGLSRSQCDRRFRAALHRAPREAIDDARLDAACADLEAGVPVAAVATATGFRHATHFAAWFRARRGCGPRAWARRNR